MKDKVRVGIVGSKFAADFHCDAYSRMDNADVVAVAALDNLEQISGKYGIPATYEDYNEMIEKENLDLVSICAPNFLHHPIVLAASAAGVHSICEKPLAISVEQAREMVEVSERNNTKLFYAEDWLHAPALIRTEALLAEGAVGEILFVKAKEVHNGTHSPFAQNKETCGGGVFLHMGCHAVTWLLYILGQDDNPVVEVTGKMTGGGEQNFIHKGNTGEDFGMGMMRFKKGQFAFAESNYITQGGMDDKIEIYGTKGVIKVDLTFSSAVNCYSMNGIAYSIEKADINVGWTKPAVDEFYNLGYVTEMEYFVDCVIQDRQPKYGVDGRAGLATVEIIQAFYESNEKGKTIYGEWI
ncbi:MAG: Gfo/Idh/MocA family oxidoreductase [Acidobacteriota bacterium]|nr:MAG: Gfo/Idh/MocA family oxidoreductase [Acidobacteriota bacterium]